MDAAAKARRVRPRRHLQIWTDISGSDDEITHDSIGKAILPCDSRSYIDGALQSLENSQASLNKRLASIAGFDEPGGPTDFDFLLHGDMQVDGCASDRCESTAELSIDSFAERSVDEPPSFQAVMDTLVAGEPPAAFDDDGMHWVNSGISKSSDLVDGQAWIAEYERRLTKAKAEISDRGGAIRELPLRNRVLKDMVSVSPPGRKVQLTTGQEVMVWFNVGAPGPPGSRVYVTEAHCPHQRVCLLGAELMEIEDLAHGRRGFMRCPRHNKRFDLRTGESPGNTERLRQYPSQFKFGCWYVGVGPAEPVVDIASKLTEGANEPTASSAGSSTVQTSLGDGVLQRTCCSLSRHWRGTSALTRRLGNAEGSKKQRGNSMPAKLQHRQSTARRRSSSTGSAATFARPQSGDTIPGAAEGSKIVGNVKKPQRKKARTASR